MKLQQCKLIIFSNFYCILSCCLNLFLMSNMLFCMYILFIMYICILLYIHVTVLYYILASFQKNKMLMLIGIVNTCKTFLGFAPWKWVFVSHSRVTSILVSHWGFNLITVFQYSWKIVLCQADFPWSFSVICLKLSRLLCTGYKSRWLWQLFEDGWKHLKTF